MFLRSDCPACQQEATFLAEHFAEINSRIKIIGVTVEDKEQSENFVRNNNLQFPIILDKKGEMMSNAKIVCTPTNFIMENGIIKKIIFGGFENAEDLIKAL